MDGIEKCIELGEISVPIWRRIGQKNKGQETRKHQARNSIKGEHFKSFRPEPRTQTISVGRLPENPEESLLSAVYRLTFIY